MNNRRLYEKITKVIEGDKNSPQILEEIKKELETEMLLNGKKPNTSIKSAFKRVQKTMSNYPKFQNVLKNGNDLFTVTNSYFLVTYTKDQLPVERTARIRDDILKFMTLYAEE